MQKSLNELRESGIEPVTISYDTHAILKEASDRFNISYTLLSDPNSEIIKTYGVVDERTNKNSEHYGHSYPVTFLINRAGKIVSLFPSQTRVRHSIDDLIRAVEQQ